jgi:hypothetical protein
MYLLAGGGGDLHVRDCQELKDPWFFVTFLE